MLFPYANDTRACTQRSGAVEVVTVTDVFLKLAIKYVKRNVPVSLFWIQHLIYSYFYTVVYNSYHAVGIS